MNPLNKEYQKELARRASDPDYDRKRRKHNRERYAAWLRKDFDEAMTWLIGRAANKGDLERARKLSRLKSWAEDRPDRREEIAKRYD